MKPYEIIEHTADVGLRAQADSLAEAFSFLAKGMFDLITDESAIDDAHHFSVQLEAHDLEQLLVDWLSELLFLHETNEAVFSRFEIRIDEEAIVLSASVFGEPFDPGKHRLGMQIKAVTYHLLKVSGGPPYEVQVLFDI